MKIDYREKLRLYLALRAALGVRTGHFKTRLESFVQYLEESDDGTRTHAELAFDWASNSPSDCHISTRSTWLTYARVFLRYLTATHPEIEIPAQGLIVSPRRRNPYIFSPDEIKCLIKCAGDLRPANSLRPSMHQTIIGLLACTGIRPGEALTLRNSNVFLEESVPRIYIEKSKFDRSRWIVLHATATSHLRLYVRSRQEHGFEKADSFFVNLKGKRIEGRNLRLAFTKLLRSAGIEAAPGERGPSLHSFRHSFAVHRLKSWYEQKADIRNLLPHLSVHMGHVDLEGTYWYLTAAPELMTAAGSLFEEYCEGASDECNK
jgi:integrase/recombinase XerD